MDKKSFFYLNIQMLGFRYQQELSKKMNYLKMQLFEKYGKRQG